jgi:vacuolar protein sorting-associated protein 13A/C
MLQYDVTGANDPSAVAVVTVDSPQIIFAVDPMFALLNFALSPFKDGNNDSDTSAGVSVAPNTVVEPQSKPATASTAVSFRFAVVQSTIMVLASDSDPSSQAIQLGIKQVELAHQVSHIGYYPRSAA